MVSSKPFFVAIIMLLIFISISITYFFDSYNISRKKTNNAISLTMKNPFSYRILQNSGYNKEFKSTGYELSDFENQEKKVVYYLTSDISISENWKRDYNELSKIRNNLYKVCIKNLKHKEIKEKFSIICYNY